MFRSRITGKIKQSPRFLLTAMIFMVLLNFLSPLSVSAATDEPDATTRSATDIRDDSATLRGSFDGNDLLTSAWFEYGRERNDLDNTTSRINYGDDSENFETNISGLRDDTVYYFRVAARNSEGTDYGNILSFRTDESDDDNDDDNDYDYYTPSYPSSNSSAPTALTEGATGVTNTSAELHSLVVNGSNSSANSWFEWGPTPNLGYRTVTMPVGSIPSVRHIDNLTGLSPGTVYYFRAVAENSYWRNNGAVLSFITSGVNTSGVVQTPPNTIIIREPVIVRVPVPTPVPTPAPSPTPSSSVRPSSANSLGASVIGANAFLPQNIFGWMVLIVLFLILLLLVRQVYTGSKGGHAHGHSTHSKH